ncbi:glycoside hydrolase family 16 protein [Apiospora phragmitis]|uniref:Glycoside hydrolase family 16 protein n=1 Tax=Apiospora phragmitis TaxID=2905665 RepID=A0ABR1X5K2_9PEZI
MHGTVLSLGALALSGLASAARLDTRWKYPDCEADNCYRAFIDEAHIGMAPAFCWDFLTTPTRTRRACPRILTTSSSTPAATTPATSSAAVPLSSSSVVPATSSSSTTVILPTASSSGPGASVTASTSATSETMTTSTVTEVHSYTVTSCSSTVVDCPATTKPYTTAVTNVYVTTCPVSGGGGPKTTGYPVSSYPSAPLSRPSSSTYVASSVIPTGTTVLTYPVAFSTSTLYATSQITVTKRRTPLAPYGVTTAPTPQQSHGYGGTGAPISPPKPTSSYLAVPTAAAGRVEIAGVVAVIGGVLAALF